MEQETKKRRASKRDTIGKRRKFFERVSKKSTYLNPEIVEEVWEGVVKVVFEDLKNHQESFLPDLSKIQAVRHVWSGDVSKFKHGGMRYYVGEEYYKIYTSVSPKLRKYFRGYIAKQKRISNLVPESPSTLVK